jgi:guanylate kinase
MSTTTRIDRRGMMLVLSSPSGAGKTTLARRLLARDKTIEMSVSVTTRSRRPGEVEGVDYQFTTLEDFAARVQRGEFLEHATVFGNAYGTPRGPVDAVLGTGRDVLFDIDWQGTQQLKEKAREDVVSIFILPPSRSTLEQRLSSRGQDSAETVARRMAQANSEISHWAEYDYVVVNDDLDLAEKRIVTIVEAERYRRTRQTGLSGFVRTLLD